MKIRVNGEEREVAAGTTVAELVAALGLRPAQVAVEVNRVLVPRARHAQAILREGDVVELVTLVGGG
ncbi:MAG: sulfur carrier protein ThiS [Planctomycetota bacterium]